MASPRKSLRVGTRGSPLALWQATSVGDLLRQQDPGLELELITIRTQAERFPESELAAIGAGVFTRELDEALRNGDIDLAVHSLKDVPSEVHPALTIAAVPERESPFDAFISRDGTPLAALPRGAKIGTGSPRRKAQLLAYRPELEVVALRGNVGTRLRKVEEQGLAGTVLAHAGLKRMGQERRITQLIPPEILLPAVGQGALAVLARAGDRELCAFLAAIDHVPSHLRVRAERAFLHELRGGCQVPAGALATFAGGGTAAADLQLEAVVAAPDGSACVRGKEGGVGLEPEALGSRLAAALLHRGADRILAALRGE